MNIWHYLGIAWDQMWVEQFPRWLACFRNIPPNFSSEQASCVVYDAVLSLSASPMHQFSFSRHPHPFHFGIALSSISEIMQISWRSIFVRLESNHSNYRRYTIVRSRSLSYHVGYHRGILVYGKEVRQFLKQCFGLGQIVRLTDGRMQPSLDGFYDVFFASFRISLRALTANKEKKN